MKSYKEIKQYLNQKKANLEILEENLTKAKELQLEE